MEPRHFEPDNEYVAWGKYGHIETEETYDVFGMEESNPIKVRFNESTCNIKVGEEEVKTEVPAIDIEISGGDNKCLITIARHQVHYLRNYLDAFLEATKP